MSSCLSQELYRYLQLLKHFILLNSFFFFLILDLEYFILLKFVFQLEEIRCYDVVKSLMIIRDLVTAITQPDVLIYTLLALI